MKVELAGLHHSPVYGVGLVIDVIDQDNFTVLAKGKHWKYEFIVDDDGDKEWQLNGKYHRTDGPAVELANGTKYWWLNGKQHRTDGPAVEYGNGDKIWYLNGKQHRTDGPAVEWVEGGKAWYIEGEIHRTDGPALVGADGTKRWYLNGKQLSEDEWKALTTA